MPDVVGDYPYKKLGEWTAEEENFLIKNYYTMTISEISEHFGFAYMAVQKKILKMKLDKEEYRNMYISTRGLAEDPCTKCPYKLAYEGKDVPVPQRPTRPLMEKCGMTWKENKSR